MESDKKNHLDNLLLPYNLTSIVKFPTSVQNTSVTIIDIIFIDISQFESYTITPIFNGLSDQDAQLLISTDYSHMPKQKSKTIRKINKDTISGFVNKLNNKSWVSIFHIDDVNAMLNSILNTYLRIFYSSFPPQRVISRNNNDNNNNWIPFGIKNHIDIIGNCT